MQSDGVWEALIPGQVDMGGHGFNATLRDWGRFGLFVANGGKLEDGQSLLPPEWIRQSTTWTRAKGSVTPATPDGQYGYQWWYVGVLPLRRAGIVLQRARAGAGAASHGRRRAAAYSPKDQLNLVRPQ